MTSCRSRSSSAEVHALELFVRFVAISTVMLVPGPRRRRLVFLASALAALLPLIGSNISFCPAAALRGFLPFAGSAPRSFAMLRFRASIRSTTFSPVGRAFAAMGLPLRFSRNSSRRFCSTRVGAEYRNKRQRPVRPWNEIRRRCRRDRKLALCCRNPRSRTCLSRYGRRLPWRALPPVRNRRRQSR
jgi:hypothetical protein